MTPDIMDSPRKPHGSPQTKSDFLRLQRRNSKIIQKEIKEKWADSELHVEDVAAVLGDKAAELLKEANISAVRESAMARVKKLKVELADGMAPCEFHLEFNKVWHIIQALARSLSPPPPERGRSRSVPATSGVPNRIDEAELPSGAAPGHIDQFIDRSPTLPLRRPPV
mmetsp:Transcript_43388/g.114738  ORF Transcript_43388/g.114738 Transcript_43388/m.114738 type:complete len:168 (+) Transcript_43388:222-725(+)